MNKSASIFPCLFAIAVLVNYGIFLIYLVKVSEPCVTTDTH